MSIWQRELPNGNWLVGIRGRLDQSLTPQLEEHLTHLLEKIQHGLVVDLTETTYINSGGLRCLVSAWRKARQKDGDLVLCGLNTRIQEIFSMIGFDKVFQIYTNCEAAQQAIRETGKQA